MAIDAFLSILGPARVQPWMCDGPETYASAQLTEQQLIEALEEQLAQQLQQAVILTPPLVPERAIAPYPTIHERFREQESDRRISLRIGQDDGLAPLQAAILAAVLEQPPDLDAVLADPLNPRCQAQALGFNQGLASYRHILDHHPQSGFYLPLTFSMPLELNHQGDLISFGSLPCLQTELRAWRHRVLPYVANNLISIPPWLQVNVDHLSTMTRLALEGGVALELF